MPLMEKISKLDHLLIRNHLIGCDSMAQTALSKAKDAVAITETKYTVGQLRYWENVVSAIRWCIKQADYRIEGKDNDSG